MSTLSLVGNSTLARRIGAMTFAFFLVKGLLWLAAPLVFIYAF